MYFCTSSCLTITINRARRCTDKLRGFFYRFSVDQANKVTQMCYSDEFRDNHKPLQPRQMKSFYKAYFRYSELLAGRQTSFWYKMKSGDIMTVNNHRVFHGRSENQDKGDNVRLLDTAYLDWGCVHSKIRIVAEKQGLESPVD